MTSLINGLIFEAHWLVLDSLITKDLDEELGVALGDLLDEKTSESERTTGFYHRTHYKHPSQLPASHFEPTAHKPPQEKTAFARRRPSTEPTQFHHRGPASAPQHHGVAKAVRSITKGQHHAWRVTFKRARKHEPLGDTEKKHLGSLRHASVQAHKLSRKTKRTAHGPEKEQLHRSASTAHRRAADAARGAEHHFRNKGHEQHANAFRHLAGYHANKAADHDLQMENSGR